MFYFILALTCVVVLAVVVLGGCIEVLERKVDRLNERLEKLENGSSQQGISFLSAAEEFIAQHPVLLRRLAKYESKS
jgi:hypothetical protein